MELTHDWRAFQKTFAAAGHNGGAVYVVVDESESAPEDAAILMAYADGEDLSEWAGSTCRELAGLNQHRQFFIYRQGGIQAGWAGAASRPCYYDQVEHLRAHVQAAPPSSALAKSSKGRITTPLFRRHFLLESLSAGWWAKVLPSHYGIYVAAQGESGGSLLVTVRRGAVDGFCEPDLSALGPERARDSTEVVRYLSEKYLVPVQGLFVPATEWKQWALSPQPWSLMAKSVRAKRSQLVPFRFGPSFLMATRAFLGF